MRATATRIRTHSKSMLAAVFVAVVMVLGFGMIGLASAGGSHTLKVPSQYLTIQAAINAAHPGDTIVVAPGVYVGQLTIDKSVTIVGAGAGNTIIQGPATVTPDSYGNPWMIELGGGATVNIEGVTVLMTLQCIVTPILSTASTPPEAYAGGAIGVGGSAYLNLQSSVVTTTGAPEGAACGGPSVTTAGIMSYGDGIGFGLDYVVGSPPASALLGFGQVVGVSISGFGFNGDPIGIGGHVDSAPGSSALIAHDSISISTDAVGWFSDIDVGGSFYSANVGMTVAASATIVYNALTGSTAVGPNDITVLDGSAYIAHNSISVGPDGAGLFAYGALPTAPYSTSVTVLENSIIGPTSTFAIAGIFLEGYATGTVSYNTVGQFECEYDSGLVAAGLCGPSYASQAQLVGIFDATFGALTVTGNLIFSSDAGIEWLASGPLVAQGNVILNSVDYGLLGVDGSVSFGPNVVVGGEYGVGAVAFSVDTTVTLTNVVIAQTSIAPLYYEVDFSGGTASIVGT